MPLATGNTRKAPERVQLRVAVYDALCAKAGADNPTAQAELFGVDRSTIYGWLNGANIPRLDTAMWVAKLLGVTVDALWEPIA